MMLALCVLCPPNCPWKRPRRRTDCLNEEEEETRRPTDRRRRAMRRTRHRHSGAAVVAVVRRRLQLVHCLFSNKWETCAAAAAEGPRERGRERHPVRDARGRAGRRAAPPRQREERTPTAAPPRRRSIAAAPFRLGE